MSQIKSLGSAECFVGTGMALEEGIKRLKLVNIHNHATKISVLLLMLVTCHALVSGGQFGVAAEGSKLVRLVTAQQGHQSSKKSTDTNRSETDSGRRVTVSRVEKQEEGFEVAGDDDVVPSEPHVYPRDAYSSSSDNNSNTQQDEQQLLSDSVKQNSYNNNNTNGNHNPTARHVIQPPYQADQASQSSAGGAILDQCCACDEAKYDLAFEGLWSPYTHPEEFPHNNWHAHFSDIIGASHSNEFRMWSPETFASEGVKELAETGSTKKLESELKQVSSWTRTIIRARELRYPTLNGRTTAVLRTDRQHHLVSILSKLGPSPDWLVGVSALELCQSDCTWTTQRVVNLWPWDAGTDSGTTFSSPDSPTRPQDRIRPLRDALQIAAMQVPAISSSGEQQGSPGHWDSSYVNNVNNSTRNSYVDQQQQQQTQSQPTDQYGSQQTVANVKDSAPHSSAELPSKPFARLYITRQRIYEKSCNTDTSTANYKQSQPSYTPVRTPESSESDVWFSTSTRSPSYTDCRFTEWSDWSACSSTCGKGIRTRTRSFVDEHALAAGCSQIDLIEKELCLSECIGNATCVTRDWSEWSKCSMNCGQGQRKRTRSPVGPLRRGCESIELAQMEHCIGECIPPASDNQSHPCKVTEWSNWSDCSVACGTGTRIRTRQYINREGTENCTVKLIHKQACTGRMESCKHNQRVLVETCLIPADPGPCKARFERWRYVKSDDMCIKFIYGGCLGNKNNFESFQDCERDCLKPLQGLTEQDRSPLIA